MCDFLQFAVSPVRAVFTALMGVLALWCLFSIEYYTYRLRCLVREIARYNPEVHCKEMQACIAEAEQLRRLCNCTVLGLVVVLTYLFLSVTPC